MAVLISDDPWFLLQVKPNGLARAVVNLERQGVHTFCPKQLRAARPGQPAVPQSLFPGYLFAAFNPRHVAFGSVNATFGVSRLVDRGYRLDRGLPPALINGLMARCDDTGCLLPPEVLKPGEEVRILTGPFAGFVATVEKLSQGERIRILFDLLGQTARADVARQDLERLGNEATQEPARSVA